MILEQVTTHNLAEMAKYFETNMEQMNTRVQHLHDGHAEVENTVRTLHEGQISMATNIKMLMRKWGFLLEELPQSR